MTIYYNAQDRKPLVKAISEFTGADAVYMRTPTYAYRIDYFTVTREGNLEFDDRADSEEIEGLIEFLAERGFMPRLPIQAPQSSRKRQARKYPQIPTAPNTANLCGLRWKFRLKAQRSETSPSCLTQRAVLFARRWRWKISESKLPTAR